VLAVNKIDLTNYDRARFEQITHDFKEFALTLGVKQITAIPMSALKGENVVYDGSAAMPWYDGPTLVETLEKATTRSNQTVGFRLPVQRVSRPGESFRGYQGTVAGGSVKPGDSASSSCPPAWWPTSPRSSPSTSCATPPSPATPSRWCSTARWTWRAAT
jgi:sulfate adenylyltransferase subunit 1